MPLLRLCSISALALVAGITSSAPLIAQTAESPTPPSSGYRRLAPGVEIMIPPSIDHADTFSRHDMLEVLAADADFGARPGSEVPSPAKNVRFQHDVWGLEFSFKPVRFIRAQVTGPDGQRSEKLVWYLYYHVLNPGDKPVRFLPDFTLYSEDLQQTYEDALQPRALAAIQKREDPARPLLNTIEMAGEIAPGQEKWGAAIWPDVDPGTDSFSIFVTGLTNAYRWEQAAADAPREYQVKTLKLNFWRPGDTQFQHEQEIRFGRPLTAGEEVDYEWVYR